MNEERDRKKQHRRDIAQRLREKAKRKEINSMKSATYQIVSINDKELI